MLLLSDHLPSPEENGLAYRMSSRQHRESVPKMKCLMNSFLLTVVLALAAATAAMAISGEEPYEAMKRGDFRVAAVLFSPLAEKGDVRAQYNLGLLYASGLGVAPDYRAALKWYRLAAGQGHAGAQNALAQMYAKGYGVPQDHVRAHMWYSVAVESSAAGSKQELMKDRDNLASRMTPAQIQKAEELAKRCLESTFKTCD